MKYGDRIYWNYTHSTGRARFTRTKRGIYVSKARHTIKHWRKPNAKQMAWVHFIGNKNYSKVPLEELEVDEPLRYTFDLISKALRIRQDVAGPEKTAILVPTDIMPRRIRIGEVFGVPIYADPTLQVEQFHLEDKDKVIYRNY